MPHARGAVQPAGCIAADPPWETDDPLGARGAAAKYDVMSLAEICAFPLPPMLPDCYLFMWRLASMIDEALEVVRAWGFQRQKAELVWVKQTRHGKRHFGLGHHSRAEHEVCIIATKGSPRPLDRSVRSVFTAKIPSIVKRGRLVYDHSAKPVEFFSIVERLAQGPHVELFSRERRRGWMAYGDELRGRKR